MRHRTIPAVPQSLVVRALGWSCHEYQACLKGSKQSPVILPVCGLLPLLLGAASASGMASSEAGAAPFWSGAGSAAADAGSCGAAEDLSVLAVLSACSFSACRTQAGLVTCQDMAGFSSSEAVGFFMRPFLDSS